MSYLKTKYEREKELWLLVNIKLNYTTDWHNQIACRKCKAVAPVPNADDYIPVSVWVDCKVGGKTLQRTKTLKTNKEFVKHFQNTHYESCGKNKVLNEDWFERNKAGEIK